MIAYANEINSVMVGVKRGRFTGKINISNPDRWKELKELCENKGLDKKGKKKELINRLLEHPQENQATQNA